MNYLYLINYYSFTKFINTYGFRLISLTNNRVIKFINFKNLKKYKNIDMYDLLFEKNKILVTGGSGRFGKLLIKKRLKNFVFPSKKEMDITKLSSIEKCVRKIKPGKIIHLAGLSRPLIVHDKNPERSILLNIIATSNLAIVCKKYNIKLIFFSTNYVYPGTKGNYKETDSLLPDSNYAWSKLGARVSSSHDKKFINSKSLHDRETFCA